MCAHTSEYFVAGRSLSPPLIFATLLPPTSAADRPWRRRLGTNWTFGLVVVGAGYRQLLLAFTIGRVSGSGPSVMFYTLGDFLANRYSRTFRGTASALIWAGSLAIWRPTDRVHGFSTW